MLNESFSGSPKANFITKHSKRTVLQLFVTQETAEWCMPTGGLFSACCITIGVMLRAGGQGRQQGKKNISLGNYFAAISPMTLLLEE